MYSVFITGICDFFCGIVLPFCLFFCGIFMLFRLAKFVYRPGVILRSLKGKKEGKKSALSSLCLALAGTLGVGNVAGVASAVVAAGPGCVFWMWVCAAVSGILKYSEIVLAVKFKKSDGKGGYTGGPFIYIKEGLSLPFLSVVFCLLCLIASFTVGNMTQTRAASDGLFYSLGLSYAVTGAIVFVIILVLSVGGGKIISAFTFRLIPVLCLAYVGFSVYVLIICRERLFGVTALILSDALDLRAGISGILFSPALRLGITRGIMSSEAGCGSAAIAYASSDTDSPARLGFSGLFEVFCDTPLLCTLTAYVVLLSDAMPCGNATLFAISCYSSFLGKAAGIFLGISIFLFAVASVASWSFYGQSALSFLGGGKKTRIFYGILFAVFAFIGCNISENGVWLFADLSISLMAALNLPALLFLYRPVLAESRANYLKYRKRSRAIAPRNRFP